MNINSLLLMGFFVGVFVFIVYGIIVKAREFLVVPVKKTVIFNEIVEKDGFERIEKDSEELKELRIKLKEQLKNWSYPGEVEIRDAVFVEDKYPFYISDIILDCLELGPGRKTRHISLHIDIPLDIGGKLDIKRQGDDVYYFPFSENMAIKSGSFSKKFSQAFYVFSFPDLPEQILTPEVLEMLEKHIGIYPFIDKLTSESVGYFNRDMIITDRGITIIGSPDGSRKDIATMLELGKRVTSMVEALTQDEV